MVETLRNMFRRKSRTFLTIFGIVIGIFALAVMGSLAEKMNGMISGGVRYYTGQITVAPKSSFSGGLLSSSMLDDIKKIPGVKQVHPEVVMLRDEDPSSMTFGMPPMIIGFDLSKKFENRNYRNLTLTSGRSLKVGDSDKVLIGSDIAKQAELEVGDTYIVRKKPFKVVGVLGKTLTAPDSGIIMSIQDARELFLETQPLLKELKAKTDAIPAALMMFMKPEDRENLAAMKSLASDELITGASVSWLDGVNADKLARTIQAKVEGVQVMAPSDMKKQLEQAMLVFSLIITGSAMIALLVGGLSVINTMTMAVSERTGEIGLKKALGASTSDIMKEYLTEASVIGLLGGIFGLGLGYLFVIAANAAMASRGADIFMMTPRLAGVSLAFAVALGTLSGIYPSVRAARLDCVQALREE